MQHAMIKPRSSQAQALFDPFARVPAPIADIHGLRTGERFHDNDIAAVLIRALAARYPVVRRLAGDESFLAAARRFVLAQPPQLAAILHFGEMFPAYLRSLGREASFEYLADVAELEAARVRALRSADAAPVDASALLRLPAACHGDISVRLHPSVAVIASRFPIVTIWTANQTDDGDGIIHQWGPEAALVARPFLDVEVMRLPAGGHAFLCCLTDGATISDAIAAATAEDGGFDAALSLRLLVDANVVIGFDREAGALELRHALR